MKDPIDQMMELKDQAQALQNSTLNLISKNQEDNTNNEILVKQDQLNKIKNDKLNKQLESLKELEHNVINKDRLVEQTNVINEKNDKNIYTLYVSLFLSLIIFLAIVLFSIGKLNDRLLTIIVTATLFIFTLVVLYTYNIGHFATLVHFLDNRRNLKLEESILNVEKRFGRNMQKRIYGDKQDWIDSNCECPDDEDIYTDEENIGVEIKPGYFYYDKNAPKQNIVPGGGEKINVSDNANRDIFDKIDWVNHDSKSSSPDSENDYNIYPNNNDVYKNGKLVAESTYTVNL